MRAKDAAVDLATLVTAACSLIVTAIFVYRQVVPPPAALASSPRKNRVISDWQQLVAHGRRIGPETASLTILYFGDFECPACGAFTRRLEALRAAHPADVSIVFRHFPLPYHRNAYQSARAAECSADQGRVEQMYATLYSKQDSLGRIPYREFARRAAVPDLEHFDRCMADTARVPRIEGDFKAARDAAIPGTPGVIINGTLMQETFDLEALVNDARRAHR